VGPIQTGVKKATGEGVKFGIHPPIDPPIDSLSKTVPTRSPFIYKRSAIQIHPKLAVGIPTCFAIQGTVVWPV